MNATGRLTADQVAQYACDGYTLFPQPVFDLATFARLKAIYETSPTEHGGMDVNHRRDPRLLEFLLADAGLDLVEPVVGPDIGLWASHFISKPPLTGRATPWHEDSSAWKGRLSSLAGLCTVWLALDEATPGNGCLKVIPGTQDNGFSEYEAADAERDILPFQIKPGSIDERRAVFLSLRPNECSLHEGRLIHGADANTSPHRRAAFTMRYFPATSHVDPEKNPGHKIWLARGRDRAGNVYVNA